MEVFIKGASMKKNKQLYNAVFNYLVKHPKPSDKVFHAWAEKNGFDHDAAEAVAYEMASKFSRLIVGGKSKGQQPKGISKKQEALGIEVEKEHASDLDVVRKIAWDHLTEYDNYYTALDEMEAKLEKDTSRTLGDFKQFWWISGGFIIIVLFLVFVYSKKR